MKTHFQIAIAGLLVLIAPIPTFDCSAQLADSRQVVSPKPDTLARTFFKIRSEYERLEGRAAPQADQAAERSRLREALQHALASDARQSLWTGSAAFWLAQRLMGDGEYRQALTILNEQSGTPGPGPVSAWALQSTRATCLQMLGRVREAEDLFVQIWNDKSFSASDRASAASELVAIAAARSDSRAELAYRRMAKELGVPLADWNTQRIGELCLLIGDFEQAKASFREVRNSASPTGFRAATIEWGELVAEYGRDFGSKEAVVGRYDRLVHIAEVIRPSDKGDRRRLRDLLVAQWSNLLDDASALAWKAREEIHTVGPDEHSTSTTLRLVYSAASSAMLGFCLEENNRPDALEQCYGMHRSAAFVFRSLGDSAFASDAAITCLGIRTDIALSDERLFGSILYHARDDGPVESDPPGGGCGENINRPSPKPR
ncbi:MAG TPA: hypothetical protein VF777_11400 [Phycisphaerales bacterium]